MASFDLSDESEWGIGCSPSSMRPLPRMELPHDSVPFRNNSNADPDGSYAGNASGSVSCRGGICVRMFNIAVARTAVLSSSLDYGINDQSKCDCGADFEVPSNME